MSFAITGLYAAILTLWMLWLSAQVSIRRAKTGVSIEHGTDMVLAQTIRRHANLTEYLPMAIILLGIAEAQGTSATVLHVIGVVLLVSRIVHPFGVKHDNPKAPLRAIGDTGTFLAMIACAAIILWHFIGA